MKRLLILLARLLIANLLIIGYFGSAMGFGVRLVDENINKCDFVFGSGQVGINSYLILSYFEFLIKMI